MTVTQILRELLSDSNPYTRLRYHLCVVGLEKTRQFGIDPTSAAIEILKRHKSTQPIVSDDSPINVSRADKSGQPDIPPTT